jgi:hypothetical protein
MASASVEEVVGGVAVGDGNPWFSEEALIVSYTYLLDNKA